MKIIITEDQTAKVLIYRPQPAEGVRFGALLTFIREKNHSFAFSLSCRQKFTNYEEEGASPHKKKIEIISNQKQLDEAMELQSEGGVLRLSLQARENTAELDQSTKQLFKPENQKGNCNSFASGKSTILDRSGLRKEGGRQKKKKMDHSPIKNQSRSKRKNKEQATFDSYIERKVEQILNKKIECALSGRNLELSQAKRKDQERNSSGRSMRGKRTAMSSCKDEQMLSRSGQDCLEDSKFFHNRQYYRNAGSNINGEPAGQGPILLKNAHHSPSHRVDERQSHLNSQYYTVCSQSRNLGISDVKPLKIPRHQLMDDANTLLNKYPFEGSHNQDHVNPANSLVFGSSSQNEQYHNCMMRQERKGRRRENDRKRAASLHQGTMKSRCFSKNSQEGMKPKYGIFSRRQVKESQALEAQSQKVAIYLDNYGSYYSRQEPRQQKRRSKRHCSHARDANMNSVYQMNSEGCSQWLGDYEARLFETGHASGKGQSSKKGPKRAQKEEELKLGDHIYLEIKHCRPSKSKQRQRSRGRSRHKEECEGRSQRRAVTVTLKDVLSEQHLQKISTQYSLGKEQARDVLLQNWHLPACKIAEQLKIAASSFHGSHYENCGTGLAGRMHQRTVSGKEADRRRNAAESNANGEESNNSMLLIKSNSENIPAAVYGFVKKEPRRDSESAAEREDDLNYPKTIIKECQGRKQQKLGEAGKMNAADKAGHEKGHKKMKDNKRVFESDMESQIQQSPSHNQESGQKGSCKHKNGGKIRQEGMGSASSRATEIISSTNNIVPFKKKMAPTLISGEASAPFEESEVEEYCPAKGGVEGERIPSRAEGSEMPVVRKVSDEPAANDDYQMGLESMDFEKKLEKTEDLLEECSQVQRECKASAEKSNGLVEGKSAREKGRILMNMVQQFGRDHQTSIFNLIEEQDKLDEQQLAQKWVEMQGK